MTIRERLKQKVEAGIREEIVTVDGLTIRVTGCDDTETMKSTVFLTDEEKQAEAVEIGLKLKSLFKIEGGVPADEVWLILLVAKTVQTEDRKPLDKVEVAAMFRRDYLVYMALVAAALKVTGLTEPGGAYLGNSDASAAA